MRRTFILRTDFEEQKKGGALIPSEDAKHVLVLFWPYPRALLKRITLRDWGFKKSQAKRIYPKGIKGSS